jgi:hypothetical protein
MAITISGDSPNISAATITTGTVTTLTAPTSTITTLNAPSGVFATQNGMNGIAKAWVNFVGTTASINSSFNISSVTRNGTGDYTINFTTAMPNANYGVATSCSQISTTQTTSLGTGGTYSTTALQVYCNYFGGGSNNRGDPSVVSVAILSS